MNRERLVGAIASAPDVLEGFMAGLSNQQVDRVRAPGLWSVREHLVHLADLQKLYVERIAAFRDNERPVMIPWDPTKEDAARRLGTPPHDALDRFRSFREQQMELLCSLDDVVWEREAVHPEYERYNLELLVVHHIVAHDGFHLYRMAELAFVRSDPLTTLP